MLLSACAKPERKLVVTAGAWPGYEPLFLARQLGWLDSAQIRLGEVPSNASSMYALSTGVADAAALTLDEVLLLRSQGIPLAVVLVFNNSAGADMLVVRPDILSLPIFTMLAGVFVGDGLRAAFDPRVYGRME